jgi:hypothetical protein
VSWFRRRDESLNERVLREAGYAVDGTGQPAAAEPAPPPTPVPFPLPASVGIGGFVRPSNVLQGSLDEHVQTPWDVVVTVEAAGMRRDVYSFAVLPDGSLIVGDECDEELAVFADAAVTRLRPPYRAEAVRQDEKLWFGSARELRVVELHVGGDELEFSSIEGESTYTVDRAAADASTAPAELIALGEAAAGDDYAVHASRLDGNLWDVVADPL